MLRADGSGASPASNRSFNEIQHAGRILVVSGDPGASVQWREALARAGYEHVTAVDGAVLALKLFRKLSPDLVILDLDLPDHEGWATLEDLQIEIGPRLYVPIVVFSREATAEMRLRALLLGAGDFCPNPFDPVEALLRIRLRLEIRQRFLALGRENAHLRAVLISPGVHS